MFVQCPSQHPAELQFSCIFTMSTFARITQHPKLHLDACLQTSAFKSYRIPKVFRFLAVLEMYYKSAISHFLSYPGLPMFLDRSLPPLFKDRNGLQKLPNAAFWGWWGEMRGKIKKEAAFTSGQHFSYQVIKIYRILIFPASDRKLYLHSHTSFLAMQVLIETEEEPISLYIFSNTGLWCNFSTLSE